MSDPARHESAVVRVRRATRDDVDALVALENASFAHDRLSPRQWRRHVAASSVDVWVATREGVLAGAAVVFHRDGIDIARLYSIAVAPQARGGGIGAALIAAAERGARRRGARRLRLEVRTGNAGARHLYERGGFRAFGHHRAYYADGEDAVRYEKVL